MHDTSLFFDVFCFLTERDKRTSITGKVYLTSLHLNSSGFYSGTTCWICQSRGHRRRMSLIDSITVFLSPETDISFYPMFFWRYLSVVIINSAKLLMVRVHVSCQKAKYHGIIDLLRDCRKSRFDKPNRLSIFKISKI